MRVLGQGESKGWGPRESYPGPHTNSMPSLPHASAAALWPLPPYRPCSSWGRAGRPLAKPNSHTLPSAHCSSPNIGHHRPYLPIPASLLDDVMLLLTFWSFLDCVCMVGPHLDYSALPLLQGPSISPCDKHLLISMFSQMLPPPGSLP